MITNTTIFSVLCYSFPAGDRFSSEGTPRLWFGHCGNSRGRQIFLLSEILILLMKEPNPCKLTGSLDSFPICCGCFNSFVPFLETQLLLMSLLKNLLPADGKQILDNRSQHICMLIKIV